MLKHLVIAENPLEPCTWEEYDVEDVRAFIKERFPVWPENAHIYHRYVSESTDVTPVDEASVERLARLHGDLFVVVYPGHPAAILVVAVVAAIAAAYFFRPKIPDTVEVTPDSSRSINNSLDERKNTPRIKGRIPDIFGQVRATPDLIAVPYRIFKFNDEYEYSYMCLGRGAYDLSDLCEDKTPVNQIDGTSVEVFGPNTSPNSGTPQLTIGEAITEGVNSAVRHTSVKDQTLSPPNLQFPKEASYSIRHAERFAPTATITVNQPGESLQDFFAIGSGVVLTGFTILGWYWGGGAYILGSFSVDGTYTIVNVTDTTLEISVPAGTDERWNNYFHDVKNTPTPPPGQFGPIWNSDQTVSFASSGTRSLVSSGLKWIGPFLVNSADATKLLSNYVADRGLYKEVGSPLVRYAVTVQVQLELTPCSNLGVASGPPVVYNESVTGSAARVIARRGLTQRVDIGSSEYYKVRACRVTPTEILTDGSIVDEIVWRDLYTLTPVTTPHFGDVTTIQVMARSSQYNQPTRKFNLLATRKIPRWETDHFSTTLYGTSRVDEILPFVCLDPYIGHRTLAEVDVQNIRSVVSDVQAYFGHFYLTEFNYSFDDANVSFEETISSIASAIFCIAFRRGSKIQISFERSSTSSVLLFNHRNKLPGTETRTVRFGVLNDNDGVEFTYVDGDNGKAEKVTFYLPEDGSAVRPKRVESVGISHRLQAFFHAWRTWNKIKYQNTTTEFDATQEVNLLLLNNRILVADDTRPNTQAGDVLAQNVLELTLDHDVSLVGGNHHIFLQHVDGSVQSILCFAGSTPNKVVLAQAPTLPLNLDEEAYARTTYLIVKDTDTRRSMPFLVTELEPKPGGYTGTVHAVNYDFRYYEQDKQYQESVITEDGYYDPGYADSVAIFTAAYGTVEEGDLVLQALEDLFTNYPEM